MNLSTVTVAILKYLDLIIQKRVPFTPKTIQILDEGPTFVFSKDVKNGLYSASCSLEIR